MDDKTTAWALYERLLEINQEAFEAGLFDAAYHALTGALHCAEVITDTQLFLNISYIAKKQLEFIDSNYPKYRHSTQSAKDRSQLESIFSTLAKQAHAKATLNYRIERVNYRKLL